MAEPTEVTPPQNPGVPPTEGTVSISQQELDDLKHKAEVSSQNFERAKKLESRVKELEDGLEPLPEDLSDPEIGKMKGELAEIKGELAKAKVIRTYPQLEGLWAELEDFRSKDENKGMNLNTAAKAFLVDKELLTPQRKGLERPTGGTRTPTTSGMTAEESKTLRETNFRKWSEMVRKDQLKLS